MKTCQICTTDCDEIAVTCAACGEGSFGGAWTMAADEPVQDAPVPDSPEHSPDTFRGSRRGRQR